MAWFRFRTTVGRSLADSVGLVLLVGLVGGLAMGSLIAARRTDASYPAFLARTDPSDLLVQPSVSLTCASPFQRQLAALTGVRRARCATALNAATLTARGDIGSVLLTRVELVDSSDGMFSRQDRVTITAGRAADPGRVDEVVANTAAASFFHLRVGSSLRVGIDTATQVQLIPAYRTLRLRVVGIGVFDTQVVQDSIDQGHTGFLFGTPALARAFDACCTGLTYEGLQLRRGARSDAAVENEYTRLLATSRYTAGGGQQLQVYSTAAIESEAQRAIRPEAVALGVFGVIAGLAALLIAVQAIVRRLRSDADDDEVLRALGAGPTAIVTSEVVGILGALVVGSLLAAAVAVALSPWAVFGPVTAVDPSPGVDIDWTVLGGGFALLVVGLGGVAGALALRQAPHRRAAHRWGDPRGSRTVGLAMVAGLPPSGVVGLRFALEPGRGRTAVPARSLVLGAVLAVTVVTATVTFGASLDTLVSHPALYGWNFDDAIYSTDGYGPVPARVADPQLARDPMVAATAGVYFSTLAIDGVAVPGMAEPAHAGISPRVLAGHGLDGGDQILLGPDTLRQLHAHFGEVVSLRGDNLPPLRLHVVGTVTLPAIGTTLGLHPSMGTGAVFSTSDIPPALLDAYGPVSGPNAILVRFRPGTSPGAGRRSLARVVASINRFTRSPAVVAVLGPSALLDMQVLTVQRPAEIVNYRAMGTTPGILAGALAAGAVVALAVTLVASVRRRRQELALLKGLGFTGGQLGGAVAWQATAVAVLGVVVGVPLGIVAGRLLWELFAHQISAVVDPTVPALAIALVAGGTVALANVVAAVPGRIAARTPTARLLRAE